ncbi:hypothetical protein FNF27_05570 [Cafeteria roenbergensis]|uniref:Uncharacterized protein n=1 Tax=Cafeteria roenbergensis TaxID=33653 RepID=A0A5A8E5D9_CAFRO|nr:hypothetical protein FNF31_00487 [Cafeteria roenbergensis]KAA0172933.1 hypothetical protein FNF27_05570 [Cafeteria roenbergensis]
MNAPDERTPQAPSIYERGLCSAGRHRASLPQQTTASTARDTSAPRRASSCRDRGGLKLADSTTGKFFKVPIVPELFHGKDPMAGKSAKQELGMVAWLSQQKGLECLSSHSAVIVDETVGGEHGEPGTVVRVVCQPFHQRLVGRAPMR